MLQILNSAGKKICWFHMSGRPTNDDFMLFSKYAGII